MITPEDVRDLRSKRSSGLTVEEIVQLTGHSYNSVSRHTRGLSQPRTRRSPRYTNQNRIVELLVEHGSLSTAEISAALDMSLGYIYNLTHFLREEGTLERYTLPDNAIKVYYRLTKSVLDSEYRELEAA